MGGILKRIAMKPKIMARPRLAAIVVIRSMLWGMREIITVSNQRTFGCAAVYSRLQSSPWRAALITCADHRASIVTREALQIISERCQPERGTKQATAPLAEFFMSRLALFLADELPQKFRRAVRFNRRPLVRCGVAINDFPFRQIFGVR